MNQLIEIAWGGRIYRYNSLEDARKDGFHFEDTSQYPVAREIPPTK
jgi:hypothetical protein